MLTSLAMMPFCAENSIVKDSKAFIKECILCGVFFFLLFFVFFCFDIILGVASQISNLFKFMGEGVSVKSRIIYYTEFVHNCFLAPNAGEEYNENLNYYTWALKESFHINITGVIIMFLSLISSIINRRQKIVQISVYWAAFSVFVLCIVGWGMRENGLILYSLYFGWAYMVLLFKLVEKIEGKLKINILIPAVTVLLTVFLLKVNIPGIDEMITFAVNYFPTGA